MLNLNKVGRRLANIKRGTYNGMRVNVSDLLALNADKEQDGNLKKFRHLKLASDNAPQHMPDTTNAKALL